MRLVREKTLYQLTFMPRMFPVNCYFVEEENGLTLIDTALPYSTKGILSMAQKIGKPITRILLTHTHDDHVGALDSLVRILPDVPVYMSKLDAEFLEEDKNLDTHKKNYPPRGGAPKNLQTKPNVRLQEEDVVGSLQVIETPGHSPGSISFLDQRNGILIAGDAFQIRGGIAVAGQVRWSFPFPAWSTWDRMIALESAKKLRDYQPSALAVGHGNLLYDPVPAMNVVIEEAESKLRS